jgi:ABC-type nitrate/sulfonate/bicarbonate transport system substrate-binding protein
VKRLNLTFISRLTLLTAALAIIFAHELYRGIVSFPQESETAVPSDPLNIRISGEITIGIPDAGTALPLIVSNGGFAQTPEAWYAKQNIRLDIEKKEDQSQLVRGFVSGRYDVIALSPDRFAALYPSLSSLHPVAFLQSGSTEGPTVIASKEKYTSIASLKKKRISCVEKSPAHFLLLYLLRENGIHPRDIRWVFTLTGDDAVRLFECGKSDVTACQTSFIRRKLPAYSEILFSTASAPSFDRCVLIAREADLLTRPAAYRTLVQGSFEAIKTLLAMKDADAAALVKKFIPARDFTGNPASLLPSLDQNLSFFRMTEMRTCDYALEYQTARELYALPAESDGLDISATQNTVFLDTIDAKAYSASAAPSIPQAAAGTDILLFTKEIPCAKNSVEPAFPSRIPLSSAALNANLFPTARILLRGNSAQDEQNSAWLAGARESAVRDAIAKTDSSAAQRLFPSGDKPSQDVSVTLFFRVTPPVTKK